MPAVRLGGVAIAICKYDVVGQDSAGTPGFVGHVGLAGEYRGLSGQSDELPLVHMRPPLEIGSSAEPIHCAGTVDLTREEILQIGLFIDEMEAEYLAAQLRNDRRRQYVIAPHVQPVTAPDGTVIYHRYSCAGFVIESYREIGIPLLRIDAGGLPGVSLETLVLHTPTSRPCCRIPECARPTACRAMGPGPSYWPAT